jgi:CyaY protein
MTSTALSEHEFERVADQTLHALDAALADLDGLEASLEMGIITLEFPDGTRYVVNSHRAAKQIWMAAEHSAWHFDPRPASPPDTKARWVASKSGDELWSTLAAVLSRKLGRAVQLTAP